METSQQNETEVTPELYGEVLAAWLERPSAAVVARELGVDPGIVRRFAREGMPQHGLDPLPSRKSLLGDGPVRTPKSGERQVRSSRMVATRDPELAAKVVLAQQEAEQHVAAIKTKVRELEDEAARLGEAATSGELEQVADGTLVELATAKRRVELEEHRVHNVEVRAIAADNTRRSADEVAAARMALKNCLTVGAIFSHLADKMLTLIESGEIEMPTKVSPRMVASLANSLDRLTSATERAIKIEKGKAGEPEAVLGVQIGLMLDSCTDHELQLVAATGQLPPRLKLLQGG